MATQTEMPVIGAGFSGLTMAREARKRGISDITILEKAGDIGGGAEIQPYLRRGRNEVT